MEEREIKFFKNIGDFYRGIDNKAIDVSINSPFQYEMWQKCLYKEHITQHSKIPYIGVHVIRCGMTVLGGHFFVKTTGRSKGVFFIGSGGETDYHDLVYFSENVESEDIQFLIDSIAKKFSVTSFSFLQIRKESPLSKWAELNGIEPYKDNECASITLSGSYDEYFKSLSKSVRQNIRTANNRVKKDEHSTAFAIYEEQVIPTGLKLELLTLYEKRRIIKTKKEGNDGLKNWFFERVRAYRKKKYNIISEVMGYAKGTFLGVYKIDNIVAAYCFGLKKNNDELCIMQVSINDDFDRYSPGMLLLTNVFQTILDDNRSILFDLTNGNERYKFSLGAVSSYTNYYRFEINKGATLMR